MDESIWYGNQSDVENAAFATLAVIEPMIQKIDLAEIINRHLPADPQAEFDYGSVLSLLVAARLYSPVALSSVPDWAETSGADVLWGIPAEKLNDDRLGRALDAFFDQRHSICASVALHAAKKFNIPLNRLHYDPTHVSFTGKYDASEGRETIADDGSPLINDALPPADIAKGRGGDHLPKGRRMVHCGLLTVIDEFGPLPIFGHTIDGNQNGRTGIREQLKLIESCLRPPPFTMLSDRGTFSVGHLLRLRDAKSHAICSVPWADVADLFDEQRDSLSWREASFLSIEQRRRRTEHSNLPREHYELAVVKHTFTDAATKRSINTRVIFVHSTADERAARERREKQITKIKDEFTQIEKSVAAGRYNNKAEAVSKRVGRVIGTTKSDRFFTWELRPLTKAEQKQQPPPTVRGGAIPTFRFTWSFDASAVEPVAQMDGISAMVTTVPASQQSADAVFTMFREQNLVEHANRQFKGPLSVRPVFLHSPRRVESLVFLLQIGLMIYFLIQRTYRENVAAATAEDGESPSVKDQRMTTQSILRAFRSYSILIVHKPGGREIRPTRLTTRQRHFLSVLGFASPAQTLSRRLPRPPD